MEYSCAPSRDGNLQEVDIARAIPPLFVYAIGKTMFSSLGFGIINYFAVSALINFVTSISLGIYIFFKDPEKRLNQSFTLFALSLAAWSLGYFFWQIAHDPGTALFWSRGLMFGAIFVSVTFTHFVFALLELLPRWNVFILLSYLLFVLFAVADFTPYFVSRVAPIMTFPYWPQPGPLYHPYLALWVGYLVLCAVLLIRRLFHETDHLKRSQIKFILAAMAVVFINGPINYLPWYGIPVPPVTTIFVSFYVIIVGYAVLRHRLLDVRVVATELLVLALIVAMFIRTVLSAEMMEFILNSIMLLMVAVIGFLLVKSVRKEVEAREEIERLATDLKKANARLRKLDKMKSEFVSIASHQLRSPLTAIRGYASMLLEGSFGKVPKKVTEAVEKIAESSRLMALSVEDYLDVSRIESGNMKYDYSDFSLKSEAMAVVDELRPEAIKRGLAITFKNKARGAYTVHADIGKTKQIIQNLVDNAMKYTEDGSITLSLHSDRKAGYATLEIADTGIGMSHEALDAIFDKFERARNANSVNVTGTGLGLFVAQTMAQAMGGDVTAYSEGEGKGSVFTLTVPLAT